MDGQLLCQLLFDYVKRKEKFSYITQELGQPCLSPLVLFNFLMYQSDSQLRSLLTISYSQYSPLPLLSWDCWHLEEDEKTPKRLVWKELLFVWDKQKSLL